MLEEKRELIKKLSEVSLTTRDFIRIITLETALLLPLQVIRTLLYS